MKLFVSFAAITLLTGVCSQTSSDQAKDAAAKSADVLANLYIILRNVVFPKSPLTDSSETLNRFVLMSPGKVLNYWDYYPGKDYEDSLLKQDSTAPEAMIPPSVMEKWFDLADVTVGGNPFGGGVTAKSMSIAYETILTQMDIQGIKSKANEALARYNMARSFLTSLVPDPDNLEKNITRMSLYDRYHNNYTQTQLEMNEEIEASRTSKSAMQYELWFQRVYPSLNSKVEGAYTKWLAFGNKNLVELYKTYLDSASGGSELERARMALRGSGVSSLDRTRTIYPVSFEPGNFYQYLLPKIKGPSRDMLLSKKSMYEAQRDTYQSMVNMNNDRAYQGNATKALEKLQTITDTQNQLSVDKTTAAMNSMMNCTSKRANEKVPGQKGTGQKGTSPKGTSSKGKKSRSLPKIPSTGGSLPKVPNPMDDPCNKFKADNDAAVKATFAAASAKADHDNTAFLLNSGDKYNQFLMSSINSLNRKIKEIEGELNASNPYLGEIVQSRSFQNLDSIRNETLKNLDDAWMSFEFDSDSTHTKTTSETKSLQVSASVGAQVPGRGFALSGHFGMSSADSNNALNSASTKVSGEVLRVVIKRPWFRPSIFEDSSLTFSQHDELSAKSTYVSPGPGTEKYLSEAIGGATDNLYLMPEYVTSFVLARNIKLEFSGVDSSTVSHMSQLTAGGSVSGNYNCFTASASAGYSDTKQSVTSDKTSTGMIITIPGAQIIGYYTNVLPRFPRTQI